MLVGKILVGIHWKSQGSSLQVIFDELNGIFQKYFLASNDKQIASELDEKDLNTSSKHSSINSISDYLYLPLKICSNKHKQGSPGGAAV